MGKCFDWNKQEFIYGILYFDASLQQDRIVVLLVMRRSTAQIQASEWPVSRKLRQYFLESTLEHLIVFYSVSTILLLRYSSSKAAGGGGH